MAAPKLETLLILKHMKKVDMFKLPIQVQKTPHCTERKAKFLVTGNARFDVIYFLL